jgi:dipeptidyl aminopeptidase/acylaminoacyl peptidase
MDESWHVRFFDPALQAMQQTIERAAPNGEAHIVNWSHDRSRALVYMERGLDGGGYYVFVNQALRLIAYRYPEIAAAHGLGERQAITYPARDGTRIPAYLTLPAGERRNMPLVLLVHGGPAYRDTLAFDWWAAFFASRGYAVLQPNFRGSSGYGEAWEEAGHRQWGGLMQTDVEDGVAALIRAGMVDASRVCIVGASYGGYAALAGATLTPDRYACAVSVAGISDLDMFVRDQSSQARRGDDSVDYMLKSIGDREEGRAHLREVSPINLVDRVRAPVLLIHGADDTVVPIAQSRNMEQRLRASGKNVRLVTLQHDDHWLSDSATRTQMLTELETFLAQNIGPH